MTGICELNVPINHNSYYVNHLVCMEKKKTKMKGPGILSSNEYSLNCRLMTIR